MKKILTLITIVTIVLLTGCSSKGYKTIDYTTFEEKINNGDSFVLVIGSSTCSACLTYKETMQKVTSKYNVEIFLIEIDHLSTEETSKFTTRFTFQSTPTTLFIVDGSEKTTYDRLVGAVSQENVVKMLQKYGYIKEDN